MGAGWWGSRWVVGWTRVGWTLVLGGGAAEWGGVQNGALSRSEHATSLFIISHPSRVEREFYSTTLALWCRHPEL